MEEKQADKLLLTLEIILGILSVVLLFLAVIIGIYAKIGIIGKIVLISFDVILGFIGLHCCILIETKVGYYKCGKCGELFIPDLKKTYPSMHFGRTRYMRCPKCNQKSWCKKTLNNKRDVK